MQMFTLKGSPGRKGGVFAEEASLCKLILLLRQDGLCELSFTSGWAADMMKGSFAFFILRIGALGRTSLYMQRPECVFICLYKLQLSR